MQLISIKNLTIYGEGAVEKMFLPSANIEYLNPSDAYESSLKITDERFPEASVGKTQGKQPYSRASDVQNLENPQIHHTHTHKTHPPTIPSIGIRW